MFLDVPALQIIMGARWSLTFAEILHSLRRERIYGIQTDHLPPQGLSSFRVLQYIRMGGREYPPK